MDSRRVHPLLVQWLIPLAVYAAVVSPAAYLHREQINPDAVVYIRKAMFIANGDFSHSISGYWSPLLSWCIAPLLMLKMDGLHAARLVLAIWGAGLVSAFYFFLRNFEGISKRWRFGATLLMALVSANLAVTVTTPDIILATLLFAYFAVAGGDRWIARPGMALLAGLFAGLAFLAKAYALPFIVLHLAITVVFQILAQRKSESPVAIGRIISRAALAVVAITIVAGPWIAVLSSKYHRPTFSTSGALAHAIMGPDNPTKTAPFHFGLQEAPFISANETPDEPVRIRNLTPEELPYTFWSATKNFAHQMKIVSANARIIYENAQTFDRLPFMPYLSEQAAPGEKKLNWWFVHLGLGAILFSPLLIPFLMHSQRLKTTWLLLTILAYCSGYLLVFCEGRYLTPVLLPLALVMALQIVLNCRRQEGTTPGLTRHLLATVVMISFAVGTYPKLRVTFHEYRPPADYRAIARNLSKLEVSGPIASSDWGQGLFVAYFMDRSYVGFPVGKSDSECEALLNQFGTGILLCWPEPGSMGGGSSRKDPNSEIGKMTQGTFEQAKRIASSSSWMHSKLKDAMVTLQLVQTTPVRPKKAPKHKPATVPAIARTGADATTRKVPSTRLATVTPSAKPTTKPATRAPLRVFVRAMLAPEMAATTRPAVKIENIPFIAQRPDFCGEACAAMWLNHLGAKWTQDQVFEFSQIDPAMGRGVYSEELGPAMKKLGFNVGEVWYRVRKDNAADLEAQWQAVYDDLKNGIPTIVVMQFSEEDEEAHMRLVLGYDPKSDEVIFHDPAEDDGAYARMKRDLFLKIWAVDEEIKGEKVWMVERIRMDGKKPTIAPPEKTEEAERVQKVMKGK